MTLGLRICCFEKEVLLLKKRFSWKMRTYGLLPDWYGLMEQDPLKITVDTPKNYYLQQSSESSMEKTTPIFPTNIYKCFFAFKGTMI